MEKLTGKTISKATEVIRVCSFCDIKKAMPWIHEEGVQMIFNLVFSDHYLVFHTGLRKYVLFIYDPLKFDAIEYKEHISCSIQRELDANNYSIHTDCTQDLIEDFMVSDSYN